MSETEIIFEVSEDEVDGGDTATASRIRQRLEGLKAKQNGWAGGMQHARHGGEAYEHVPSIVGLEWLQETTAKWFSGAPVPSIHPTREGGVNFEWDIGPYRPSMKIDLEARSGDWHCHTLENGVSVEHTLDLADGESWTWLTQTLHTLESARPVPGLFGAEAPQEQEQQGFHSAEELRSVFRWTSVLAGPGHEPDWEFTRGLLEDRVPSTS